MTPAVKVLSGSTWIILKALRIPESRKTMSLTVEEFRMMASELSETGEIPESVHDIVVRASRLSQIRVEDVMVPRPRIVRVEVESVADPTIREKTLEIYKKHPFTNFPVTSHEGEHVLGVVNVKDLLLAERLHAGLLRPVSFCVRGITLDRLLATMQTNHTQMSVVVDEHGVVDGIITLEDILEEFLGEIESDVPFFTTPPVQFAYRGPEPVVEGTISLHELSELFSVSLPRSASYSTLAGFLLDKMGRIPNVGDSVEYEQWRFEVVGMAGNRIRKVRITTLGISADSSDLV